MFVQKKIEYCSRKHVVSECRQCDCLMMCGALDLQAGRTAQAGATQEQPRLNAQ